MRPHVCVCVCVCVCVNTLHTHRDKCINQLWKSASSAHACTLRNQSAHDPRTYTRAPRRLGSGCPFKNPNPRPMIYQTPIIKKMSREGHLALHWRKLRSFPRSYRKALHLVLLRGYKQSASSPLLAFLQQFSPCQQTAAINGKYPKTLFHQHSVVRSLSLLFSFFLFLPFLVSFQYLFQAVFFHVALSVVLKCSCGSTLQTFCTSLYLRSACFSSWKTEVCIFIVHSIAFKLQISEKVWLLSIDLFFILFILFYVLFELKLLHPGAVIVLILLLIAILLLSGFVFLIF